MQQLWPYKNQLPEIDKTAFIASGAQIIGNVNIGAEASIWYNVVIRGDVNDIHIGARTNIQDGTVIHVSSTLQGTFIGDDVTVGHMALIHACTIEDGAFIGMKACVMDGAIVEKGAMVGAAAVVTAGKRIPSGELWVGSPARFFRKLNAGDMAHIQETASHYAELAQEYRSKSL